MLKKSFSPFIIFLLLTGCAKAPSLETNASIKSNTEELPVLQEETKQTTQEEKLPPNFQLPTKEKLEYIAKNNDKYSTYLKTVASYNDLDVDIEPFTEDILNQESKKWCSALSSNNGNVLSSMDLIISNKKDQALYQNDKHLTSVLIESIMYDCPVYIDNLLTELSQNQQ
jgi:hypothetical protein